MVGWLLLLGVIAILAQAAVIGNREAHATPQPESFVRPLVAPPGQSDGQTIIEYTPVVPDGRVWVELTPGRSGLIN